MSPFDLDMIRFPGQQSDERVFLFLRRHWVSFLSGLAIVLVMIALPVIMTVFLGFLNIDEKLLADFVSGFGTQYPEIRAKQIMVFIYSAYYFFVASYFLILWLDYYFDITIVTNERIIDIRQVGLFNRAVSELYLLQIQDVTAKQVGVVQNIFHYGDVHIQTAGEKTNFVIDHVKDSYVVARRIVDLQEALMERRNSNNDDSVEVTG